MDIIRRIDLRVDEQKKYEVIKKLVDENGNKNRATKELDLSRRQIDRLQREREGCIRTRQQGKKTINSQT